ncbi:MAG: Ni/Fe-hydrogenase cytochrome b subunit [bacterium]|nr:Ni/Fe-hydrogenase cytochrome b subunit [bacterium]
MSHKHVALPVAGPIFTQPFKACLAVFGLCILVLAWRFVVGLGPTTGMNDGFPWGIWIAFDVVTGTALACGGFSVAILCYVFNKGKYHALIRPAVLTSVLGYTLAGASVIVDLGRYWNVWKIPLLWNWNRNSVLLEVAVCIMTYVVVLWIELFPAFIDVWEEQEKFPLLCRAARRIRKWFNRYLMAILALGILLPTMHQSSLGSLMLIMTSKLHKLWHTPFLPVLFLSSAILMGYAAVIFESALADEVFDRPRETEILAPMSGIMVAVLFFFLGVRIVDLALRGRLELVARLDFYSWMFLLEMALFLAPALLLLSRKRRRNPGIELISAILMMVAGTLYRFDTFLVGFRPGPGWSYFPTIPEMTVTIGFIAFEVMAYLFIVKMFPILHIGVPPHGHGAAAPKPSG